MTAPCCGLRFRVLHARAASTSATSAPSVQRLCRRWTLTSCSIDRKPIEGPHRTVEVVAANLQSEEQESLRVGRASSRRAGGRTQADLRPLSQARAMQSATSCPKRCGLHPQSRDPRAHGPSRRRTVPACCAYSAQRAPARNSSSVGLQPPKIQRSRVAPSIGRGIELEEDLVDPGTNKTRALRRHSRCQSIDKPAGKP